MEETRAHVKEGKHHCPKIVLNLCYSQNCSVSRELQQADNLNLVFSMVVSEHVMQMRFRVSQGSEVNLY